MKIFTNGYHFFAVVFLVTSSLQTLSFSGHTTIIPRSDTENAARSLAGWQEHINDYNVGRTYFSFYIAPEYKRSFHNGQLSDFLLGCNNCFGVEGSRVPNRSPSAILADYFGLPQDFKSTVCFNPVITSLVFDIQAYIGFDAWCPNLYMRIHAPVVHTKWDLNMVECVDMKGTST